MNVEALFGDEEFQLDEDAPPLPPLPGDVVPPAVPAEWSPVPLLPRRWEDAPEADDDWCFLCEVGDTGHNNPYYRMLVEYIHNTSGLVSDESLCHDIQDMYNRELRPYNDPPMNWSRRSIMRHIEEHSLTPVLMLRRTLRVLNEELRVMEDGMLRRRSDRVGEPDELQKANVMLHLRLIEARSKLLRELAHAGAKQK